MAAGLASEAAVETFIYLSGGGTIREYLSLFLSFALPDRSLSLVSYFVLSPLSTSCFAFSSFSLRLLERQARDDASAWHSRPLQSSSTLVGLFFL
jgi:hypothetical protein